jgi:hypothetical protein
MEIVPFTVEIDCGDDGYDTFILQPCWFPFWGMDSFTK